MEKKNNGLIIVLIAVILVLGGFIAYDKLLTKTEKCTDTKPTENTAVSNPNDKDSTSTFLNNYKNTYLKEEHSTLFSENDISLTAHMHWEISKITLNTQGNLIFKTYSRLQEKHQSDTYTYNEKVLDYVTMKTNGAYNVLYILTQEGKVKKLNDEKLKNVEIVFDTLEVTNPIVIKRCDLETETDVEQRVCAIDINGNVTVLK